jgi:hypothetical protein
LLASAAFPVLEPLDVELLDESLPPQAATPASAPVRTTPTTTRRMASPPLFA